jgi:hypothetical protein
MCPYLLSLIGLLVMLLLLLLLLLAVAYLKDLLKGKS